MRCPNCGKEIKDGSRFCLHCGAGLGTIGGMNGKNNGNQRTGNSVVKQKKNNTLTIVLFIALAFIIIAGIFVKTGKSSALSVAKKTPVDLNQYITVSFSGNEGIGTAYADFDKAKFVEDNGKGGEIVAPLLSYNLVNGQDLKNGDIVSVVWNCDDNIMEKYMGRTVLHDKKDFEVSGLTEVEEFDPFENIVVRFKGDAPNAEAILTNNDSREVVKYFLNYKFDKDEGLSNGDHVTLKAYYFAEDDKTESECIKRYGVKPSVLTKEFVVSGLNTKVSSLSEITDKAMEDMKKQSEDVIASNIQTYDLAKDDSYESSYIGSYLLTPKDITSYDKNMYFLVYKQHFTNHISNNDNTASKTLDTDVYWCVRFTDLKKDEAGNIIVDLNDYSKTVNYVYLKVDERDPYLYAFFDYYGYESLEALYDDNVTSRADRYNCESDVEENAESTENTENTDKTDTYSDTGEVSVESSEETAVGH